MVLTTALAGKDEEKSGFNNTNILFWAKIQLWFVGWLMQNATTKMWFQRKPKYFGDQ
jgi:hypothetical protein